MPMALSALKKHFGLSRPYNFYVAIPFLLSLILLAGVLAAAFFAGATGRLSFGSSRFFFFFYLAGLLVLAAGFSRRAKISLFLIVFAFTELTLGAASAYLAKKGFGMSALPPDVIDRRFDYHPLLQGVPTPSFRTMGKHGEVRHNSFGARGQEIGGSPTKKIFVYGGSSTYDIGLGEGDTWVEQLNSLLGGGIAVVNFGVPGYSTVEHIVQTAFYGDINDEPPACAVYYIGWNDARSAYIPNLDKGYADFHLPSQIGNMEIRKIQRVRSFSPLSNITARLLSKALETAIYPKDLTSYKAGKGEDKRLERIYLNNIQVLSAINRSRKVPTVFIGQIMNREKLKTGGSPGWFPLVKDEDIWSTVERLNKALGKKAGELHDGFIDAGIDHFQDGDFVDEGHFNQEGAKKFARLVSEDIKKYCRLSP